MHPKTFDYVDPTPQQRDDMAQAREAAKAYADVLGQLLPDGPDKTYVMRSLRMVAMWANVAICRQPDGTPR